MSAHLILGGSLLFQVLTAVLAFRLIWKAQSWQIPWTLIAITFGLLAVERGTKLAHLISGTPYGSPIGMGDLTGLWVSTLFFVGLVLISPKFAEQEAGLERAQTNEESMLALNDNLGRVIEEKKELQDKIVELEADSSDLKIRLKNMETATTELRKSTNRFQRIFDEAGTGMVLEKEDTGIVLANKAFAGALLYDVPDILGRRVEEFLDPRDMDIFKLPDGQVEVRFLRSDGYFIWTILSREEIVDNADGVTYTVHEIQDITETLMDAEAATGDETGDPAPVKDESEPSSEIELTYKGILDASGDVAAIMDLDLNIITANENFCRRLGAPLEDLVGQNLPELFVSDVSVRRQEYLRKVIETGEVQTFDDERNGRWYENTYHPILDESGQITRLVAFAKDVTDRKKVEAKLRREGRIQELITQTNSLIHAAPSVPEAYQRAIDEICRRTGWIFGHVYEAGEGEPARLTTSGVWHLSDDKRFAKVRQFTDENSVAPGEGIVGRVFQSGKPAWTHIVNAKSPKARSKVLYRTGLRSAIMMPIVAGDQVYGVAEFMSDIRLKREPAMLEALSRIGSQLGLRIEQMRVNALLEESQQRFKDYAEATADRFWETDRHHRYKFLSAMTGNKLNFQSENVVGKTIWEMGHDQYDRDTIERLKSLFRARKPFKNELFTAVDLSGEAYQFRLSATPYANEDGNFAGFRGTTSDETSYEESRKLANEVQQRFLDAMENISAGFVLWDEEDRLIAFNSQFREAQGDAGRMLTEGLHFLDHMNNLADTGYIPDGFDNREDFIAQRVRQHQEESSAHEVKSKTGQWLRIFKQKMPDGSTIVFQFDVTELKEAEEALRLNQERFRDFAESGADWFYEMDDRLKYTFFSSTYLLGIDPVEPIGKTRWELLDEIGATVDPDMKEIHISILKNQEAFMDFEYEAKDPAGNQIFVEVTGKPIFDENDNFVGYRGLGRNITQRKNTEEILRRAMQEAQSANRAKSEFLANMSHELRTPLNAIIGFSESLVGQIFGPLGNDRQEEYLINIRDSGQHLLNLINEVLDISAAETGHFEIHETEVSLKDVVASAVSMVREQAVRSRIHLINLLEYDAPVIYADETRLRQVFVNLLSNSVKYSEAEGRITIGIERPIGETLEIYVEDSGIGMDDGSLVQAMEKFGRAPLLNGTNPEGTGLGLPLSKALVEAHDGEFRIDSAPGVGTTVRILLSASRVIRENDDAGETEA